MVRQSYKEKWQAALRQQQTDPTAVAKDTLTHVSNSSRINTDLNLAIQQIASVNGEVVRAAVDVVRSLDETTSVAGLQFPEILTEIDSKSHQLPVHVALRRVRDVLRIVEARYAVLAIHAEELATANAAYKQEICKLDTGSKLSTRTLLDNAWIGPHSTEAEREDYQEQVTEYRRFDLRYEDVDDIWITHHLTSNTVLKQVEAEESDSDGESSDPDTKKRIVRSTQNRRAIVTPQSPTRTRLREHTDLN